MNHYISSDYHFFHDNVLKFCSDSRPFSTIEEMNEKIIDNHNEKVTNDDYVYLLGDISFGKVNETIPLLKRLNGKLRLILGNHDYDKHVKEYEFQKIFDWIKPYHEHKLFGKNIIMFHYPISEWNKKHRDSFHFHGHKHSKNPEILNNRSYDVGLDGSPDFAPYNIEELLILTENKLDKNITRFDHHDREI